MAIKFTIPGEPVPQGRPRAGRTRSGKIVMYDPSKSKDYKEYVALIASQHRPKELLTCPISLTVKIYRPIPASWSKIKQEKAHNGVLRPTSKPDLSNYIKGIEDALEGVLLKNDSQVVDYGDSGKWYSHNPRAEVEIIERVTA